MPDKPKPFRSDQANRISDAITELSNLLTWVEIEHGDSNLISYWHQSGLGEHTPFIEELRENRDLIGMDMDENKFNYYSHFLRDTVTRPANALCKQIDQWRDNHPDQSNGMFILAANYFNAPIPNHKPDPNHELRLLLTEVQTFLSGIRQDVTETMKPLFNAFELIDSEKQDLNSEPKPMEHARICLIRYFEQEPIFASNAPGIAIKYGLKGIYAGKKLHEVYSERFSDKENIKAYRGIKKHIIAILEYLSVDAKKRAEEMLKEIDNKR